MPTMFKYKCSVSYAKMYSTFTDHVAKDNCAYILMPISQHKHLVTSHSLQFDFNARGELLNLSFQFFEHSPQELQIKGEITSMKKRWERGGELSILNKKGTTVLKLELHDINSSKEYLSEHVDMIGKIYHMPASFIQTMKVDLLDPSYLRREFARLRGKVQKISETPRMEKSSECSIM